MRLSPDSPELTAYALGELDAAGRAAVEAALEETPGLRAELAALSATADTIAAGFAAEPAVELSPAHRASIVRSARNRIATAVRSADAGSGADVDLTVIPEAADISAPSLRDLLTIWRQRIFWAAAALGVAAVAVSVAWPRPDIGADPFGALRYQPGRLARAEMPAPVTASETRAGAKAGSPVPVPASLPGRGKALDAPTPLATTDVLSSLQSETDVRTLPRGRGLAGDSLTPSVSAPDARLAPTLAKRYGLASPAGPAVVGGRSSRSLAAGAAGTAVDESRMTVSANGPLANIQAPSLQRSADVAAGRSTPQLKALDDVLAESLAQSLGRGERSWAFPYRRTFGEEREKVELSFRYAAPSGEAYAAVEDNPFKEVAAAPLSTFGMDVDTGSYSNIRRFLRGGSLPPPDAVRLEELVNYFRYDYPQPRGDAPLGATVEVADCPWADTHQLVRVGIQARSIARGERPRANLVFLLDVSGSMEDESKLPLVKRSMRLLLDKLTPRDTVGIVTYAGESKVALKPVAITPEGRAQAVDVLEGLRAGSGTHGSAGIRDAYAMATNHFIKEGVNRVVLCTDGDFNIGVTDRGELLDLITGEAKSGVFLSVLGFGMGNLKDTTMETLADKGNGNYAYLDSFSEARKVLVEQLDGTLVTVAKDAKVQVEFNPARVARYRLLGYEKRLLRDRDFNDDTKDAGEVGAGHSVTVLYEIVPVGPDLAGVDPLRYATAKAGTLADAKAKAKAVHTDELLDLKLRYKLPDGDKSSLIEQAVKGGDLAARAASTDLKFAAAVAGYGMLLRDSPHKGDLTWEKVLRLAEQGLGEDKEGYRAEFIDLARQAQKLGGGLPGNPK